MRKRILWTIGLVSLIVLMMPSAAALTIAPAADGYTHVTDSACMNVTTFPHEVTVTLGSSPDTVNVPMDIKWFDERTGSPPQITHHFQMSTTYGGNLYSDYRNKYTAGGMSWPLTDSFYIQVPGVTRYTTMWVLYSVSVSYTQSGTVLCSVDNSRESPPITFYFV